MSFSPQTYKFPSKFGLCLIMFNSRFNEKRTHPLLQEDASSFPSGRELVGGGLEEGSLDRPVERAAAEHPVLEGVERLEDALRLVQVGAHLAGGEGVA